MNKAKKSFWKEISLQFRKFAAVGLIGSIINIIILYILTDFLNIYYIVSAVCAFVISMTHNFILNKIWTFKEKFGHIGKNTKKTIKQYGKYFVASISVLCVNLIFLYIFVEYIGLHYLLAQIIAIILVAILNFAINRKFTFGKV